VNVTTDSQPGWVPLPEQEKQALATAREYFAKLDNGHYEEAYAMLADIFRADLPLPEFVRTSRSFRAQSGPLIRRDVLKATWTKNPAAAPLPGIYAALDVAARFQNVDRYCGYLILYQQSDGGHFQVMREEQNLIDNAAAKRFEQKQSRAALDAAWTALAKNCPNYQDAPRSPAL
jgi:hypothetical protein